MLVYSERARISRKMSVLHPVVPVRPVKRKTQILYSNKLPTNKEINSSLTSKILKVVATFLEQ